MISFLKRAFDVLKILFIFFFKLFRDSWTHLRFLNITVQILVFLIGFGNYYTISRSFNEVDKDLRNPIARGLLGNHSWLVEFVVKNTL